MLVLSVMLVSIVSNVCISIKEEEKKIKKIKKMKKKFKPGYERYTCHPLSSYTDLGKRSLGARFTLQCDTMWVNEELTITF